MKKIIASAVGLMLVSGVAVTTASAVESQFGGYWRTRFVYDQYLRNTDTDGSTYTTDTRTRLYYTAKFNDDFKFVNKFEFNTTWGDSNGGDIGADGTGNFRIKSSYVDFTLGMVNTKVGIQGTTISRGFIFADDFSGAVITADLGAVKIPVVYMAALNSDAYATPSVLQQDDVNIFSVMPTFAVNDMISLTPHATYEKVTSANTDIYWVGLDADLKMDSVNAWFTGIYNGGQVDDNDVTAFLVAAGADAGIVHGQAFYVSGEEADNVGDTDAFQTIQTPGAANGTSGANGTSYYWAEILGLGIFDNVASNNSPGDHLTNIWAANLGVTVKPMDKVKIDVDAWYAQLNEDVLAPNGNMEKDLGLELDGKLTYALMDDLNAEFVFAYLFAGDATGPDDVIETGVQLSLKF